MNKQTKKPLKSRTLVKKLLCTSMSEHGFLGRVQLFPYILLNWRVWLHYTVLRLSLLNDPNKHTFFHLVHCNTKSLSLLFLIYYALPCLC